MNLTKTTDWPFRRGNIFTSVLSSYKIIIFSLQANDIIPPNIWSGYWFRFAVYYLYFHFLIGLTLMNDKSNQIFFEIVFDHFILPFIKKSSLFDSLNNYLCANAFDEISPSTNVCVGSMKMYHFAAFALDSIQTFVELLYIVNFLMPQVPILITFVFCSLLILTFSGYSK